MAPKSRPAGERAPRGAAARALMSAERLAGVYPAACELVHSNPFELTIATILSAQTTDRSVNSVTPKLFRRYPGPQDLCRADPEAVEEIIRPTGFYRAKTRSIMSCACALVDRFEGRVPERMEDLVTLPGIGRKTANVILGVGFGIPGLPVDTHVTRLSRRLGLTTSSDPVKIESMLCRFLPPPMWTDFSLRLILHGRRVCDARRPRCEACVLNDFCPSSSVPGTTSVATAATTPASS
ncbi:MAG TPA: endonuclease III [Candidatus Nitrosotalea sp.]|nr:endonuclease III [Candidatus Nitrosotalea sp.]